MKYCILILLVLSIAACKNNNDKIVKHVIDGQAQGTFYSITYYAPESQNLKHQLDSLLDAFNLSASNYNEQSIISKVNRNEKVVLDSIFLGNFNLAMEVSKATNGYFDITVRPLVEGWGFGKQVREDMSPKVIDSLMQFVGYNKIKIVDGEIVKTDPRVQLDFDALAQGYSSDVVGKYFEKKGIKHYLINIGGEIYASKDKLDGSKWEVGIEQPKDNSGYGESIATIVPLSSMGMTTSGNYRKFYIKNGVRCTHTLNPFTGYTVSQNLLSATVIAKNAATADAYATTFMVMGVDKTKEFVAKHPELEVYLIYSDKDGTFQHFATPFIEKEISEEK